MSLRTKLLTFLLLTVILATAAAYAAHMLTAYPRFVEMERRECSADAQRIVNAVDNELEHLKRLSGDWGYWDDTYKFVQDRNQQFVDANLTDECLANIKLNMLAVIDLDGRAVWGKMAAEEGQTPGDWKWLLSPPILRTLLCGKDDHDARGGLIKTPHGLMLVSACPILTSQQEGPARGVVVMGRLLDAAALSHFRRETGVEAALLAPGRIANPRVLDDLRLHGQSVEPVEPASLRVYKPLRGMDGEMLAAVAVDSTRSIASSARDTTWGVMGTLLLIGTLSAVGFTLYSDSAVLHPIRRLAGHMKTLRQTQDLSTPIQMTRRDEIGQLALGLNGLCAELHQVRHDLEHRVQERTTQLAQANEELRRENRERHLTEQWLRDANTRLQYVIDNTTDLIFQTDSTGRCIFANRAAERITGYPLEKLLYVNMMDLCAPEYREQAMRRLAELMAGAPQGEPHYLEIIRADGQRVALEVSTACVRNDGKPVAVQGIARDVTERVAASEQLRRNMSELEKFNRLAVGREMRMIELKREVNEMARRAGVPPPYDLAYAETPV